MSYLPSKTLGCFSGRLMSAANDQKLFCKLCSPFCCSYSSAILTPPVSLSITSCTARAFHSRLQWLTPLPLLFVAVLSYHQVVSLMTMRYWPGDFGNIVGWLLKDYIVIFIFSKSFHNLIFTAILWSRKIGIMVIKRKKLNTDTFIEETGWRFFASAQGKKLFDEKIKAFLTLLSHIRATCGFWTVKMWLNLIEMHCKYKNTHAHTRFGRLSIKYWLHIEMEIF